MKALTIQQPWATLTALGVRTIETRSWSTSYRGALAIHAGTYRPPMMHLPPLSRGRSEADREHDRQTWMVIDTIRDRVPRRSTTPTLYFPYSGPHGRPWDSTLGTSATEQGTAILLPLGAVIATCTLVDVVPILANAPRVADRGPNPCDDPDSDGYVLNSGLNGRLWLWDGATPSDIEDQRPYGDFAPGRYAWLLADVVQLDEPVPAKGRQELWEWAV